MSPGYVGRSVARAATIALALTVPRAAARAEAAPALRARAGYVQVLATAAAGDGLRFNNPYRLATVLGRDAESVSRTAAYGELGGAFTLGAPLGVQHGAALRWTFALEGVAQSVVTPSYLVWRRWTALAAYGRLGVPVVVAPDLTWGGELAAGAVWFFRGALGLSAEAVADVFYGAGTPEARVPAYPVVSGQLGIVATFEVLP